MKSMIINCSGHQLQNANRFSVSKKVMMLALLILGTNAMVNAQTAPIKTTHTKEVKMGRHKKEKITSMNKEVAKKSSKKHLN